MGLRRTRASIQFTVTMRLLLTNDASEVSLEQQAADFLLKRRFSTSTDMDLYHLRHIFIISAYAMYVTHFVRFFFIFMVFSPFWFVHIQVNTERDYDLQQYFSLILLHYFVLKFSFLVVLLHDTVS